MAELRYTWSVAGEPGDGLLLLRDLRGGVQALWSDSWHTPAGEETMAVQAIYARGNAT